MQNPLLGIFLTTTSLFLSTFFVIVPAQAERTPVVQPLNHSASSIRFGVDSPSPTLKMSGSFNNFSGTLHLDPSDVTKSKVNLFLDLQSVQLPPDQIMQTIFLQTALAHLHPPTATFTSNSIESIGGRSYLVHGTYTWQGKSKPTTVPIEIVKSGPTSTEIKVALSGVAKEGKTPPELAQMGAGAAGGAKGWARATFIFAKG